MLSGLKFIPRDQLDKEKDETLNDSRGERRKSGRKKETGRRKSKRSRDSSSEDEGLEKLKSGSRRKKKWYNSEEDLPSSAEESGSESETDVEQKKHRSRTKEKKLKKKAKSRRKEYSSEDESVDASETEKSSEEERHHKRRNSRRKEDEKRGGHDVIGDNDVIDNNKGSQGSQSQNYNNNVRKEMGLDWMLRPKDNTEKISIEVSEIQPEEVTAEKINPRELNPYLKDSGSGYPEESDGKNAGGKQLLSSAVVGDGGASWRLKALKRAQEQATREGRKVKEVVEERWSSIGHLAASVSSRNVASTHAHLQAINSRRRGLIKEESTNLDKETADTIEKDTDRTSVKDFTPRHPKMRVPKVHDSLSWGKRGKKQLSTEDAALVSAAMSDLNKFSNDGSFLDEFVRPRNDRYVDPSDFSYENSEGSTKRKSVGSAPSESKEDVRTVKPTMSANQLAAKALQLRMKGKLEEAEQLLKEAENIKAGQDTGNESSRPRIDGTTSRFIMNDVSTRQKKKEEDGDLNLAQKIVHNHRYSVSGQADEEYDYDDGPKKKTRKKGGEDNRQSSQINYSAKRILTQQERCQFCFENPSRPKHLVVAIGNFTYLALPQRQPVVPGHCGILTLQHESSTRTVDDNVWDEIRNFKKCLIMMFAKQERDVVFLETVMGLAQQRRHCMVECIPLPPEVAKQAPVYFKKAIDEAEDEWSQHNAKKLIDTSQKGLRASIPKNFPYFHVEFGLNKGFVHVIDDEKEFKSSFGINVIRGMLQLPAEDMHRRQRHESVESQRQAVASFARDWEPFDWTKQLI